MYPKELIDYLIFFHAERDYFECHEVLEEYWKEQGMKDKVWVGLIQIAVSMYHHRRNNFSGALKMLESAYHILQKEQENLTRLGFDYNELIDLLSNKIDDIRKLTPYQSINLPLSSALLTTCQEKCALDQLTWGTPSDLANDYLINKHTLRDRTEVIEERESEKNKRK